MERMKELSTVPSIFQVLNICLYEFLSTKLYYLSGSIDAFQFPYAINFPYIDKEVLHLSVGDEKNC